MLRRLFSRADSTRTHWRGVSLDCTGCGKRFADRENDRQTGSRAQGIVQARSTEHRRPFGPGV